MQAPYPADTRAKGWRFELDYEQIAQSSTWALAGTEARPWLLMIWLTAWQQTPCGSLPADEAVIAAMIGAGTKCWAKHRATLLRGWSEADDGRLYHNTVSARVLEMIDYRAKAAKRVADYKARAREQHAGNALPTREQPHNNDTGTGTGTGTGTLNTKPLSPSGMSPLAAVAAETKTKRGERLPTDWAPDEAGMAFAASLLNGGSGAELDRFRDYWAAQPGQRGVKVDWPATWRNWCRKAAQDGPAGRGAVPSDDRAAKASYVDSMRQLSMQDAHRREAATPGAKEAGRLALKAIRAITGGH